MSVLYGYDQPQYEHGLIEMYEICENYAYC